MTKRSSQGLKAREENNPVPKDATTQQIQKLISSALSESDHAPGYNITPVPHYENISQLKRTTTEVVRLGGIHMLSNSMQMPMLAILAGNVFTRHVF